VSGFHIARRDEFGDMAAIGRGRRFHAGKFLAQEILALGCAAFIHVDAGDHRIAAWHQKQFTVIVAGRAVKELCEIHGVLRNTRGLTAQSRVPGNGFMTNGRLGLSPPPDVAGPARSADETA
jgi:hypothetical protein